MQSEGQGISWRLGPTESSALHPKVSRTYSVIGGRQNLITKTALSSLTPRRDLSIDVRSSPDGSAGNLDERKPTIGSRQIDASESDVTLGCFCGDDDNTETSGCESRADPPDAAVPPDWSPDVTGSSQPCPQQQKDSLLRLSVTEGALMEGDAKSSPVASESRDELLQCEADSFALEDVLRHYWLLSDHDDDSHRVKLRREPIYGDAFDWLSKRSPGGGSPTAAAYLLDESKSQEPIAEAAIINDVASSSSSSFQYEQDEDADSVVTLSTISEEDSAEISSSVDASLRAASLFGNTEPKIRHSSDQQNDADHISKESERFSGNDLSAVRNDDETSSENSENPELRIPDGGLESEENEFPYSSNAAFDSLVRTFSRYVSDVYPYSPAFISHPPSTGDEGQRWTTSEGGEGGQDAHKDTRTQLQDDNRSNLQLALQEKDRLWNFAAGDDSPDLWYSANGSGNVSTIASPTSWYTVSDVFDEQSYETASENTAEEGLGGNTAFAKCTAFARYDGIKEGADADPPLPPPPPHRFRSSVTARATAGDPIVALSKAAARAATLAAVEVVRSCDRCPGNIEVALTANCAVASQFGDCDNNGAQPNSKTDVEFERLESHHVAAAGAHRVNSISKLEDSASISKQRVNPTAKNALSYAATEKAKSDSDQAAEFSCGIAIPRTRNGELSTGREEEFDADSVIGVHDFAANHDSCEVTSVAVLDCAKIKRSRSKQDSADAVEIVLGGIKIVTENNCQTSDVVDSAVTNSKIKTNSAGSQTTNNPSGTTHGTVKLENSSENPGHDREKVETQNKKPCPKSPSERLDGHDERMETSRSSHQLTRSLSHLLETDIDTLEHRRMEVSRNGSAASVQDCKSHAVRNLLSAQQRSDISSDFCLWNSSAPSFNKEALEEMLADSSPVRYLTKKQWNSQTEGRYTSEPNLQPSGDKGRVYSGGGKVEKGHGNAEHSFDGLLSDVNSRALNKCSVERIRSNFASPQREEKNSSAIERYDQSPSLRRRSLSMLSTSSSGRYGVPGTTTTPEMQRRLGQGQTRTKSPDSSRRRSLRPVSSSFENLVDSLLGITAIMSMETAASHSRPLFAPKAVEIRRKRGDSSPLSIRQREFAARSLQPRDEETGGVNQGTEAPLAGLSGCADSVQTTPVHSVQVARKRVHFRKAKHIFRKCSFCIDGNDRKTAISPTRNRAALVSRKDANGAAKSH